MAIFHRKLNYLSVSLVIFLFFASFWQVGAEEFVDTDGDQISDFDEINIYKTDPNLSDTDQGGYSDWVELNNGFSPLEANGLKLEETDFDNDFLSDRMELNFGTDIKNNDSDGDGFIDGAEIIAGYDPLSSLPDKLDKRIEVDTASQRLSYFLGGVRMGMFIISSGIDSMPTPKGHFKIENKHPKAWSPYGLWMPYWMAFSTSKYGFHELPIWPSGYTEGEDVLGTKASHGCVRLDHNDAEFLYNWAEIGTPVFIH